MKKPTQEARIENVYQLEGRVPIAKAIPFGLQHVLAMVVANVAPLIIISSVAVYQGEAFTAIETTTQAETMGEMILRQYLAVRPSTPSKQPPTMIAPTMMP